MPKHIDTLLLLALPASGKSEARRFLLNFPLEKRLELFHVADTTQLDDFPYVHYMRCVDDALADMGKDRVFFKGPNSGFLHSLDWGTLLHLVGDDYAVMKDPAAPAPSKDPATLLARLDTARQAVGAPAPFASMDPAVRKDLAVALQGETDRLVDELFGARPDTIDDKTLVIEFARGGPEGADMPIAPPHGYQWNLAQLPATLLEKAAILYIWVTPEESRRKNVEREDPNDPGSILAHSAPEEVMRGDYGCDDIEYLIAQSPEPDTIQIEAHGRTFTLPICRFDNRQDKTTFLRGAPSSWPADEVKALHEGLEGPMRKLWAAHEKLHP
jgi:hypothetical protein